MAGFQFDGTVRLGDLLVICSFIGIGMGAYFSIRSEIKMQGFRLDLIDATLEDQKRVSEKRQQEEVNELKEKVKELSHWRGFVNPSGEYNRNAPPLINPPTV